MSDVKTNALESAKEGKKSMMQRILELIAHKKKVVKKISTVKDDNKYRIPDANKIPLYPTY